MFDRPNPLQRALTAALECGLSSQAMAPEYQHKWKRRRTAQGLLIPRLIARPRRTCATGCSGWPTPDAQDFGSRDNRWQERREEIRAKCINGNGFGLTLGMAASLAGWPTPVADDDNKTPETHLAMKQRMGERDGTGANRTAITSLQVMAQLAGWGTASARDGKDAGAAFENDPSMVPVAARLPRQAAALASGPPSTSSPAGTASPDGARVLNPGHSAWLMGYPLSWLKCGWISVMATRSPRRR